MRLRAHLNISCRLGVVMILSVAALAACGKSEPAAGSHSGGKQAIDTAQLAPPNAAIRPDTSAADTSAPVVTDVATISTTSGDIVVDLYGKDAPRTVQNFVGLARKHYYDGIAFHRVVQDYIIQAGDPNSRDSTKREEWGTGGESFFGQAFEDELNQASPSGRIGYRAGTVAMANSGPNTNTSQFFIVLNDNVKQRLPYNYTIFGYVRGGMNVVHRIEQTGGTGEMPLQPARIKSITVRAAS